MSSEKIRLGNDGTEVLCDAGENIEDATVLVVEYKKPDGTLGSWTGAIFGTDFVRYVASAADLNQEGVWLSWAFITAPSGSWRGRPDSFEVLPQVA